MNRELKSKREATRIWSEEVYKPGSVFVRSSLWEADCPAPRAVHPESRRATLTSPVEPCFQWGLPGRRVSTSPVRSYRTISPFRGIAGVEHSTFEFSQMPNARHPIPFPLCNFCGAFRRVTPPGRYPASLLYEARTFLCKKCEHSLQRPPDRLTPRTVYPESRDEGEL